MCKLKCLGLIALGEVMITGISGGFSANGLSILVKDVAKIHGREVKDINRLINKNREKFRDGIDIIDLKVGDLESLVATKPTDLVDIGISLKDYGQSNNIYLLSERGYSKITLNTQH